ncbi:hypothetical protein F5876DRAFT_62307 [Lentinula aff. lateritia]|uniref:Uncharacterized protein n=1 Tax=Lentinula aff. lateritia TaxID=2804960 RepID=A0ACC1UC36_9AGAR|nr:hypothetical protein F5876DRAFT_62307 [Lentinula aff. lateritia]
MSDSDFDTSSLYVPFEGMYITFSFDIQETLDLHHCDPEDYAHLFEDIKNFPAMKYVGILIDYADLPLPQTKYQKVMIRPLQKGLNIPISRFGIEEDMCTPVSPETNHPLSRISLQLNKPLPWSGCYHPNLQDINVRLPTESRDYSNAYEMTDRSLWEMRKYLGQDAKRRKLPPEPEVPVEVSSTPEPGPGSLLDMKLYGLAQSRSDEHAINYRLEGSEAGPSQKLVIEGIDGDRHLELEVHHPAFAPIIDTIRPDSVDNDSEFTPVVKFDSDISAVDDFPNAYELYDHLDALEALVKKCKQGPPLAPGFQTNVTAAATANISTDHLPKEKIFSIKLRRLALFTSKKQSLLGPRKPTNELRVEEAASDTNYSNGEEVVSVPSTPKHLDSLMNIIVFFRRKNGHEHAQAIGSQLSTPAHTKTVPDDDRSPGALANTSTDEDNSSTHIDKNTSQFGKRSPATRKSQQHHKTPKIGRESSSKSMKNECIGPSAGFHEDATSPLISNSHLYHDLERTPSITDTEGCISFSFDIEKTPELNNCYPLDYAHLKEEVKNFPVRKYVGVLVKPRSLKPNYVDNDAVFTPVVKFDSDIAALKDFPSGLELCSCLDVLEALVKKCQQGLPLAPEVQGCITGAVNLSMNEVAAGPKYLSKKKRYSRKLKRFTPFLSKTKTFTVFCTPTKELKATIRDTKKSMNVEESSPKSMKNSTIRFMLIILLLN